MQRILPKAHSTLTRWHKRKRHNSGQLHFPTYLLELQKLDTNFPDCKQCLSFSLTIFLYFLLQENAVTHSRKILRSAVNFNAHSCILRNGKYCKISSNVIQKRSLKTNTVSLQWKSPKNQHPCHSVQLPL